jgi:predicted SnoaL-like aldol condensation-catalyzing enzyme
MGTRFKLRGYGALLATLPLVIALTAGIAASAGTGAGQSAQNRPATHGGHFDRDRARLEQHKRTVVAFYTLAFNGHQPEEAVRRYVGPVYIQHNPFAADGPEAFIAFVNAFPQASVDIKRVIAERDLVITHSQVQLGPQYPATAAMDMFRLKHGKIVEHWDVVQEIPAESANDNGMF